MSFVNILTFSQSGEQIVLNPRKDLGCIRDRQLSMLWVLWYSSCQKHEFIMRHRQPLNLETNTVVPDLPLNLPCEITGKSPTFPGLFPQLSGPNNDWLCVLSQMLWCPTQSPFTRGVHPFPAAVLAKGLWIGFSESLFQVLLLESPT